MWLDAATFVCPYCKRVVRPPFSYHGNGDCEEWYKMLLEELRWKKYPVGSDGYICLVDVMGTDESIVQAARVSYGVGTKSVSDDETLIRYLYRCGHWSPYEQCEAKFMIRMQMDIHRQMIRHRTACLSGDTLLQFDLPGGKSDSNWRADYLSVSNIYNKFKPTRNAKPKEQRNPYHKRDRIQGKLLRSLNEDTKEVRHTHIVDIWETGIKDTWSIRFNNKEIKTSEDHLFLTSIGWRKLKEVVVLSKVNLCEIQSGVLFGCVGPGVFTGVKPSFNIINELSELWLPIPGWETYYEVSDQGRIRRIVGGRGSRSFGRCKQLTVNYNHAVVSLNRPGVKETRLIHQLVLSTFVGPCPPGLMVCHNNVLNNLRYDTSASNAADRIRDGATTKLMCNWVQPEIIYTGENMTYDLEVDGPWHNFSANGFIVHNSVNEYSTRYSEAIDSMATTDSNQWRLQSQNNKQGSTGYLTDYPQEVLDKYKSCEVTNPLPAGTYLTKMEDELHKFARGVYEERLKFGIAREQARKDLPLSNYTEYYWKCDLRNIFNFLSLRMDSHAQLEIREYANAMYNIVKQLFPISTSAFDDYDQRRGGLLLSAHDIKLVSSISSGLTFNQAVKELNVWPEEPKRSRERDEAKEKLIRLGVIKRDQTT